MKTLLLPVAFAAAIPAVAQSSPFEIGLAGGVQLQTTPRSSIPRSANPGGALFVRYQWTPRWKAGVEFGVAQSANTVRNEAAPGVDVTYYTGAPLTRYSATVTHTLHAAKWQSALTLKGGYAKAFGKDVVLNPGPNGQTQIAYPPGSGFAAGLHFEQSRMFSRHVGFVATAGLDYYRINWSGSTATSRQVGIEASGNIVALPLQIGLFLKP